MKGTLRAPTARGKVARDSAVRLRLLAATCTLAAAISVPLDAKASPAVAIHLTDYADTSYADLAEAQHIVAGIFSRIGVRIVWREHTTPPAALEPTAVNVLVLSPTMAAQKCIKEQI